MTFILVCRVLLDTMPCLLQALTPLSASARGAPALSTQSRDVEAELQKLIQARQKDGQTAFSELKSRSGVRLSNWLLMPKLQCCVEFQCLRA